MKANDPNITAFHVEFNTDNAFICGTNGTLRTVAINQLQKLDARDCRVIVTDPYLIPRQADAAYVSDIIDILKSLHAKSIVLCSGRIYDMSLFQSIQTALQAEGCRFIHNSALSDCHDRFWFCVEKNKAVVFGTSMNGLCRKICRIDELRNDEVMELKHELQMRGII